MLSADCDCPKRSLAGEVLLAFVAAAVAPLAHHIGKAVREALAARRAPPADPAAAAAPQGPIE